MYPEAILALLAVVLVLAIVVAIIVLPIVAIVRTRRIGQMDERLAALERQMRRFWRIQAAQGVPAETEPLEPVEAVEPQPEAPAEAQVAPAGASPAPAPAQAWTPPVSPAAPKPAAPRPGLTAKDIEAWIGGRGLGWAAVLLLLFAVAFFLKVMIDRGMIGELERVGIGLALGVGLCGLGLRFFRRGWKVFSQMLTAAGIVIVYLSTFATFGFYRLLPQDHATIFLIAIILEAAALAIVYDAPAIAIMAVVGGLLTPLLLHSERDRYVGLFTYLAVLNAGTVALAFIRAWPVLGTLALAGTQAIFWGWYAERYHPLKLTAALTFQTFLFALYLGHAVLTHVVRRRRASIEELARVMLNALLFAVAAYVLLDPDYRWWLGTFAVGMATIYTLLTWFALERRAEDPWLVLVTLATAMAFLAAVFPLQAEPKYRATWITVGWAVQGLALWWFGLRVRADALRGMAVVLFVLAAGRLLLVDTPDAHHAPFIPVFNTYGLPALVVAGCLVAAALVSRRYMAAMKDIDLQAMRVVGLAGVALLWVVLSVEAYDYFAVQARVPPPLAELGPGELDERGRLAEQRFYERQEHLQRSAQVALSVLWAAFAIVILAVGLRLPSRQLRWAALGLFGITLGKVVLWDMAELREYYRVLAFLVLSLMMGAGAWGYQKLKHKLLVEDAEEAGHENA